MYLILSFISFFMPNLPPFVYLSGTFTQVALHVWQGVLQSSNVFKIATFMFNSLYVL